MGAAALLGAEVTPMAHPTGSIGNLGPKQTLPFTGRGRSSGWVWGASFEEGVRKTQAQDGKEGEEGPGDLQALGAQSPCRPFSATCSYEQCRMPHSDRLPVE